MHYDDGAQLETVLRELSSLPPLVTSWEVEALKQELAEAALGNAFLLQGGDCAESFVDCTAEPIAQKLKILLQMSLVLVHGARRPVVRVGRMAGQYAKPRSQTTEQRGALSLPSYRGDLVNRSGFTLDSRKPDPTLMLRGYERAALTLNFVRGLVDGGFADLHHPEYWDLEFLRKAPQAVEYDRIVESIRDSIDFLEAVAKAKLSRLTRTHFYASHEGLVLPYEQAQTRQVPRRDGWYNLSTHLPWIGMRTAHPDGAHVEYFRGLRNPIGIKVGPAMSEEWLHRLLDILHPHNEPGRITLIHRLGAKQVDEHLPRLIESQRKHGTTVLWCVDPMHGNTESTPQGFKTRRFDNIVAEIERSFAIHSEMGSRLGGIHLELTGENVTECIGGVSDVREEDLARAYRSAVDPRLNYEQALEVAMRVARNLREASSPARA